MPQQTNTYALESTSTMGLCSGRTRGTKITESSCDSLTLNIKPRLNIQVAAACWGVCVCSLFLTITSCCLTPRDFNLLARKEEGLGGMWLEVCRGESGEGADGGSRLDSGLAGWRKGPVPVWSASTARSRLRGGQWNLGVDLWPLPPPTRPIPSSPALGWQEELELYCHPGKNSN